MSPDDLTPSVVVYWLRKQATRYGEMAKKFNEAAQALETTVDSPASASTPSGQAPRVSPAGPPVHRARLASPLNKAS